MDCGNKILTKIDKNSIKKIVENKRCWTNCVNGYITTVNDEGKQILEKCGNIQIYMDDRVRLRNLVERTYICM